MREPANFVEHCATTDAEPRLRVDAVVRAPLGAGLSFVIPGRAPARTRNLEIPGSMLSHRPGMTAACIPAARCARVLFITCPSKYQRAQGMPGGDAPAVSRANNDKAHERSHHRFTGSVRHSL